MTTARWHAKADAYAAAHAQVMGSTPSHHHVCLALSVAQHESGCGDELEGNWGATTVQGLSGPDKAAIMAAGLSAAVPANLARAQALLGDRPGLVLWRDYSQATGWYFTWFFKPANDVQGAAYFVKILVHQRPACAAVLNDPNGTTGQLAEEMYVTSYFLGVHAHDHGGPGDTANIAEYTHSLDLLESGIVAALADWVAPGGGDHVIDGDDAAATSNEPHDTDPPPAA
jgi:hypothetical protein